MQPILTTVIHGRFVIILSVLLTALATRDSLAMAKLAAVCIFCSVLFYFIYLQMLANALLYCIAIP